MKTLRLKSIVLTWEKIGISIFIFLIFINYDNSISADFKDIIIDTSYHHAKYSPIPSPEDTVFKFRAYTTCFDLDDDDNGDGQPDLLGIPHWVSYEMKALTDTLGKSPSRPSKWITVKNLFDLGLIPSDDSYHFSNQWRRENEDSPMLGYDRGHMCMKYHAWRLGREADWNTHTILNACPQRSNLNQGIWLDLENKCSDWADDFEEIWIIAGPIIYDFSQTKRLGEVGEFPITIPDAFFKIIIKEIHTIPEALAFIYPQEGIAYKRSGEYDHKPYLTSIDIIEALTGLDFFPNLNEDIETEMEKVIQIQIWH